MMLVAAAMLASSLLLLIVGAVVTGTGQGMGFQAAVTMVSKQSEPQRRAEITSALFVVLYVAISVPVVGVGVLAQAAGLRTAGVVFAAFVAVVALIAAVLVTREPAQRRR
jgi:MFS family permease